MSSVTNTFKCVLPLWTMNVWPTNSGTMVQARAQVVTASFTPESFCRSILANNFASTYGPFLSERPIIIPAKPQAVVVPDWPASRLRFSLLLCYQLLHTVTAAAPAADDCFVRCFAALARHAAFGAFARGADRMAAALGAAFTAAVRVIDRVHGRAADVRLATQPTSSPCLAPYDRHAVRVTGRSHRRPTCGG